MTNITVALDFEDSWSSLIELVVSCTDIDTQQTLMVSNNGPR